MTKVYGFLFATVFLGASTVGVAEEHCLVVQAMALTGYEQRMQLLVGTDEIFTAAYGVEQDASRRVSDKYRALFAARNSRGERENPENNGGSFKSAADREEFFRQWHSDIQALEAAQRKEIAEYSAAFEHAMAADHNPVTRRRLARINAQWKREFNAPCYWGEPR